MNPSRPSPVPDFVSGPFFEGLAAGELRVQRCTACGALQIGELACNACHATSLEWIRANGKGAIHSFVVMHSDFHPAFTLNLPYNVATVELDEGPRLYANITGIADGDLRVGMRVTVGYSRLDSGVTVPVFSPDS